jgi:hypothetical protein
MIKDSEMISRDYARMCCFRPTGRVGAVSEIAIIDDRSYFYERGPLVQSHHDVRFRFGGSYGIMCQL